MIEAILFMVGLGGVCGVVLAAASKIFYVYEDPRIAQVENCMAGANCGGCGFAGCSAAAVAVVTGAAPANVCIVGGMESATKVAAVMGMEVGGAEVIRSYNYCSGGDRAPTRFEYMGVASCQALSALYGGQRECHVGCMGLGDCVKACAFDAIHIGPDGYPVVDPEKCVGCGACERACPKNILKVQTMSKRLLAFNEDDGRLAPCAQTCPAQINIPKYIEQIRHGDYEGAVDTLRERNPLILSCGRVCPHPCETYCRRGVEDEAVSINQLKRFVADFEMNSGRRFPISCAPDTGKRIAVIGGGPAGLSCAFFLRRLGHDVTIFDMMPELGGMIRYGIPEYRLPKEVLKWECDGILKMGIEAKMNVRLGKDFDLTSLVAAGYDAIFLGIGAWKDYDLGVEGENLGNAYTGISFLTRFALDQQTYEDKHTDVTIGKQVVVVGGGNTAIDCVRTLKRLGADQVTLLYRRTRAEMPANMVEIEAAEHEHIKFHFLAAPTKVIGDEKGNVKAIEFIKMELGEPDASGRRRPVPIKGSETVLECDMLVSAIGQGPDVSFATQEPGKRMADLKITKRETIDAVDPETLQTNIPYVFAAGDAQTGASLVVEAIGGGRRAARSIHLYLSGQKVTPPENSLFKRHIDGSIMDKVPGIIATPRVKMPELDVEERIQCFDETDLCITEEEAIRESNRCLNCCQFCYNPDTPKAA